MVREVNAKMLNRYLSLVKADDREWKKNHLLFANNTALVADLEEKLC